MIVLAFSCTHLMNEVAIDYLLEENETISYAPIQALIKNILENPPDAVVNLGDFSEPFYDEDTARTIEEWVPDYKYIKDVANLYELSGNHDRGVYPQSYTVIDGVRYEHGDRLVPSGMSKTEEYIRILRKSAIEWGPKLVHGHSHFPNEGWPLDVGSITYSRTYGLIEDGEKSSIIKI